MDRPEQASRDDQRPPSFGIADEAHNRQIASHGAPNLITRPESSGPGSGVFTFGKMRETPLNMTRTIRQNQLVRSVESTSNNGMVDESSQAQTSTNQAGYRASPSTADVHQRSPAYGPPDSREDTMIHSHYPHGSSQGKSFMLDSSLVEPTRPKLMTGTLDSATCDILPPFPHQPIGVVTEDRSPSREPATMGPPSKSRTQHPAARTRAASITGSNDSLHGTSKVTKHKKAQGNTPARKGDLRRTAKLQDLPSSEDVFELLLARMQHDKRIAATVKEAMTRRENELQASNATHGELSAQIEDLKREYNELNAEMDKLYDHEQAQGAELQKYKEDVKVWKAKFRKVEKVVEHLNEERDALISDADTTDKQRECLQLQIGLLEQRLEDGRHCMEEGKNLLNVERERNGSLEAKLLQISEDQQSILVSRQEAAVKLDQLLEAHKASSEQSNSIPDQKGIAMAQDRCINMLMELQNAPVVASEDIQKLDRGIGAYAECVALAFEQLSQKLENSQSGRRGFELQIQDQVKTLDGNLKSQKLHLDEMADLRKANATLEERLRGSESVVAENRQILLGRERDEKSLNREIIELKSRLIGLQSQYEEAVMATTTTSEVKALNTKLEGEVAELRKEINNQRQLTQQKDSENIEIQGQLAKLRDDLGNATHAKVDYNKLKKQLYEAGRVQVKQLGSQHQKEVGTLQKEKGQIETELENLKHALAGCIATRSIDGEARSQLQVQVEALTTQVADKDIEISALQEIVRVGREAANVHETDMQALLEEKQNLSLMKTEAEEILVLTSNAMASAAAGMLGKLNEACHACGGTTTHTMPDLAVSNLVKMCYDAQDALKASEAQLRKKDASVIFKLRTTNPAGEPSDALQAAFSSPSDQVNFVVQPNHVKSVGIKAKECSQSNSLPETPTDRHRTANENRMKRKASNSNLNRAQIPQRRAVDRGSQKVSTILPSNNVGMNEDLPLASSRKRSEMTVRDEYEQRAEILEESTIHRNIRRTTSRILKNRPLGFRSFRDSPMDTLSGDKEPKVGDARDSIGAKASTAELHFGDIKAKRQIKGLGPIIPEIQFPGGYQRGRPKVTYGRNVQKKSSERDNKFRKRFSEQLSQ